MKIGVVSDTHGLLHRRVFDHLDGVEMILHAGDIGGEEILTELESIAPVLAVSGNTDGHPLAGRCREREIVEFGRRRFYLTHRVVEGGRYLPAVMAQIRQAAPQVVIYGHTHQAHAEYREGILFFNPGPAGERRQGTTLSLGLLELTGKEIRHHIHYLD